MINQCENYEQILASIANDIASLNVNIRTEKRNMPYFITKYKIYIRKKKHKIKLLSQKVQILSALVKILLKTKNQGLVQNQHIENELIHDKSNDTTIIENFMNKTIRSSKKLNGTCNRDLEDICKKYFLSEESNRYLRNKLSILESQLNFVNEENELLRCQILQLGQDDSFQNKMKGNVIYNKKNHIKPQFVTQKSTNIPNSSQFFKSPVRKLKSHLSLVNFLLTCQKQFLYEAQEFFK